MVELEAPSAADGPEVHADWLELRTFAVDDKNSSIKDLLRAIRTTGTEEAFEALDDADKSEVIGDNVFEEIEDRSVSCAGLPPTYPFAVNERYIELRNNPEESIYTFLLLLATYGKDAGPRRMNGAQLFELLSTEVAAAYLGGAPNEAFGFHFGFPRRNSPRGFRDALDGMCSHIGEGGGCDRTKPNVAAQRDGDLDLVAWRPFKDRREGKLIAFGQCASGNDWKDKLTDLQIDAFCDWMLDRPPVLPLRLFFVPHRVEKSRWRQTVVKGGVVFDRCRMASFESAINEEIKDECKNWSRFVIRKNFGL